MKKCIVMVPASSSSKHFIPAIVERGYQPIIIDPFFEDQESDYRNNFMSDNSFFEPYNPIYMTNKHDINEVVDKLRQYDIEAIIAGSDVGAELTDQLNTIMGLRGNSSETTYRRHDKLAQQESLKEAVYIVDKEAVSEYPESMKVFALEDVSEEKLPENIKNVIYHAGTRFETLEELYKKLSILKDKLEKGGCIMISPWGASSVPYGERGIECVLMAMGLKVEIPKHTGMKLLQKAVAARKI